MVLKQTGYSMFFRIFRILTLSAWFMGVGVVAAQGRPTGLMVDLLRRPERGLVTSLNPPFSWLQGSSTEKQVAYRIKVSSSIKQLSIGKGDYWDSGWIRSSESTNIPYAGKALSSDSTYFWQVGIQQGVQHTIVYSDIQQFKMGPAQSMGRPSVMPLEPETNTPLRVVAENSAGNFFADFGRDAFGTVKLRVRSEQEDTIFVSLGEKCAGTDRVDPHPGATIRYRRMAVPVYAGERWVEVRIPSIARHISAPAIPMPSVIGEVTPFRYCEVETHSKATRCLESIQLASHYYWDDQQSDFTCSDTILNQLWQLSKYSIKATSFCGVYVDGDRERTPYEGDGYINQLGHYCTDREYSMARYSTDYLIDHPTWPTEWILHAVLMAYADYLYTGDLRLVEQRYRDLQHKTLLALARKDGLISTRTGLMTDSVLVSIYHPGAIKDIVDWPLGERDGYEMVEVNTVVNAFHFQNLKRMAELAKALNKEEDFHFYQERAHLVRESFNTKFFDPVLHRYRDGEGSSHTSLHANLFALAFGLVAPEEIPQVVRFIQSKGMACSVYAAHYLLAGLYDNEQGSIALALLRSTDDRSWYNMIQAGSTITLEAWDQKYKPNLDWNHAWGAAPANLIPRGLWGILPLEPGFKVAQVKPQLGDLTWSTIKVPTIRGLIEGEIRSDHRSLVEMTISLPAMMHGILYIPTFEIPGPVVYQNGRLLNCKMVGEYFKLEVEGGKSSFTVKSKR